jgi:hypothetical protein
MKSCLTRRFRTWRADDHEIRMTSLVILVIGCSSNLGTLKAKLARSDDLERVTRIELAWPAWKVATAVLAGGHRVVCVRFQLTLDDCDSPCLMAR